jgi:hypothetical protein
MCDNHSHTVTVGEQIMGANDMLAAHNRRHPGLASNFHD